MNSMTLPADPDSLHRIVRRRDTDKSPQPVFWYRYLSYRKWLELSRLQESLHQADDDAPARQEHWLRFGLLGWEHVTDLDTGDVLEFDPARIMDVVTMLDAQEMLGLRLLANLPDLETKKKLPSPSESDTARPAAPAEAPTGAGPYPTR